MCVPVCQLTTPNKHSISDHSIVGKNVANRIVHGDVTVVVRGGIVVDDSVAIGGVDVDSVGAIRGGIVVGDGVVAGGVEIDAIIIVQRSFCVYYCAILYIV